MSYRRGQAPGDLDADGVRKFLDEQLLKIQRATGEMDKSNTSSISALEARVTALEAIAHGQCKFVYVNATTCKLMPCNGDVIKIAGKYYQIPAAGLTITNASFGAAANVLIYIYAYITGGAVTLGAWSTGHVTDTTPGNVGVEVKSDDNTKSLVGMIYSDGAGQFFDSFTARQVRSWYNDDGVVGFNANNNVVATSVTSWVELDAGVRVQFLGWKNECYSVSAMIMGQGNVVGNVTYSILWVNGAVLGQFGYFNVKVAGYWEGTPLAASDVCAADMVKLVSIAGQTNANSATWAAKAVSVQTKRRWL